jgi:glycosyltransferase involved in cell wall biosynthesis
MSGPTGGSRSEAVECRLSVSIITKNESLRIARCLGSVAFADQIVVLDSGSTDGTAEIARRLGAEVLVDPDWPGFGRQKNRALAMCRHPWVLSIDADEVVSEQLRQAILEVVRSDPPRADNGYWITRRSRFCGQTMRFGLWSRDRVLRLFRRDQGRFTDDLVHEHVTCAEPLGTLPGILYHDSVDSVEDAREKTFRYARIGAAKLRANGKGGRLSAWSHAAWSFVRGYILRLGFLDGRNGLVLACLAAQGTYWRYRWAAMDDNPGEK